MYVYVCTDAEERETHAHTHSLHTPHPAAPWSGFWKAKIKLSVFLREASI